MRYNINEIINIIEDKKSEINSILNAIQSKAWVAAISSEHLHVMNYLCSLQDWIRSMNETETWHIPDEQGATIEEKLRNVFSYSYNELLKGMPPEETCTLPAPTKARIFLDIGTPATNTAPGERINLLAATVRSGSDDLLALVPHLLTNTEEISPYEFIQVVCADSENKHSLTASGYMPSIFNLVSDKAKAVDLVDALDINPPAELRAILDRFTLENELGRNTPSERKRLKV